MNDMGGLVASPPQRLRRKEGAVGFHQQPVDRNGCRHLAELGRRTKGHHSSKPEMATEIDRLGSLRRRAGEGVEDRGQGPTGDRLAEHGEDVGNALAGVNDQWQGETLGQSEVTIEPLPLNVLGRVVAVPIEPRLADGGNPLRLGQGHDPIPFARDHLPDIIGVNACRCHDPNFTGGEISRCLAVNRPGADHRHPADSRGTGPRHHLGKLVQIAHRIEMAMAVEEVHAFPLHRESPFFS